jgi:TPR repeat protein
MRGPKLIALAVPALAVAGISAHVGSVQVQLHVLVQAIGLGCTQLPSVLDAETPSAAGATVASSNATEPSLIESACRAALASDPANPTIMFRLGRSLSLGNKPREAIKYYLDAAERGQAAAMVDLGYMFEQGLGVPKNLATALVWHERAAGLGHAGAMIHLGRLSEDGRDVPQDFAEARRRYEQAAALGNAVAMNSLADLFRSGRGMAPDPAAAASWYLKATQQGHASAMNSLGELNEAGAGVSKNLVIARSWYKKAAELGHADAMGHLGALLESGQGGPQSLEVARDWYAKGAALNSRVAMHHLGAMLESGRGTPTNLPEAVSWYQRAAALDYPPALNDLGRLYLAGTGVAKNPVRAKTFFERAAELGDADAMNNLGLLYLNGSGVLRDIGLARTWLERAIALGHADAQKNLRYLEESAPLDGAQVAARRGSCMETCQTLHKSYVNSVCDRYSATADDGKPERTSCVSLSLTLARQCRDTCREWAATRLTDNRCAACFQSLSACDVSPASADHRDNDKSFAAAAKTCQAASADCTASCRKLMAPTAGMPGAGEKPN